MAITRRWQAGFETGDTNEFSSVSSTPTASSAITAKTGTYSLQINAAPEYGIVNVTATRQLRVGFWWYDNANTSTPTGDINLIQFRASGGTHLIGFQGVASSSVMALDIAGTNQDTENNIRIAEWHHILIDVKVDSSTGWAKVYRDGVEILTFSGNTGNSDIVDVLIGAHNASWGSIAFYFDDIYIDDTTGEGAAAAGPLLRFYYINPNGNGNYNGNWDGSDGDTTNNYALVDEVPASSTDYVSTATADESESHIMSTFTLGAYQSIVALIPLVECLRQSTTEQIAIGTRYSGTDSIGIDQTPGAAYKAMWDRQTTKPGGGSWDQTALDGVEVVYKSRGTY